jgi:hypothetical protein
MVIITKGEPVKRNKCMPVKPTTHHHHPTSKDIKQLLLEVFAVEVDPVLPELVVVFLSLESKKC